MLIQQCRRATSSLANSRIGRNGAKGNIGSRSILTWNRKFGNNLCQLNSTRRYTVPANYSSVAMASSHLQVGTRTAGNNCFLSLRDVASSALSLVGVPRPAALLPSLRGIVCTRETTLDSSNSSSILSWAIWLIKRTYQPSLLKKKRQCGYMKRRQSVGGRRILKRRRQKGRKRLFGA